MHPLKFSFAAALFLLTAITVFSQKQKSITISVGASQAIGSFASTTASAPDKSAGFAGAGIFVNALFKKNIKQSKFAVGALLNLNMNFFKINTVIENYKRNNPGFTWTGNHSNWISVALMPGICYSTPLSAKARFTAGLFTGIAAAQSPTFTLNGVIPANSIGNEGQAQSIQKNAWAITVAGRLSAGVEFAAGKKTTLVIQAGYNYLKPTFSKILQTYTQVIGPTGNPLQQYISSRSENDRTQTMCTINIGIGMVLGL